jgi:rhamnogalacturonyl hydrolase YesR
MIGALTLVPAGTAAQATPDSVIAVMVRAADWQLAHPSPKWKSTDWHNAAFYAGIMALSEVTAPAKYQDAMVRIGQANHWQLGVRPYQADDTAVGQTYADLARLTHDLTKVAPMRERFDFVLTHPKDDNLNFDPRLHPDRLDRWSWCDALFMAPPAWAKLSQATGDPRYANFAVRQWWITSQYLYDRQEHLYFRDSTYFDLREKNGQKVYWARGNGWVMAGIVRMLQALPGDHPDRTRFLQQFREMAFRVAELQQADGFWRSSLLDPASYPMQESSGTGFFCSALAWGVNEHVLDRKRFGPVVEKAWAALETCVTPDGRLTHVQPVGSTPVTFDPNSTEPYGVGAFLLAGREMVRFESPSSPTVVLGQFDLRGMERSRLVALAGAALHAPIVPLTSVTNPRSAGGLHDFSSEGDYWWPDPAHPTGPYIRRDGLTNPENFTAHRRLLLEFARNVGALAAVYDATHQEDFAAAAVRQLRVWLVDSSTRMNPDLRFAQAIHGVSPGRGIGIIDTLHLAEVALAVDALRGSTALTPADDAAVTGWFRDYLRWIITSPNGVAESRELNNHSAAWVLQVAAYARLTGDETILQDCRRRYETILLPKQMAADGCMPLELARTKPYGYSLFTLDIFGGLAVLLSSPQESLLNYQAPGGQSFLRGVAFLAPFIADKSKWARPPDVMSYEQWPVRQPALLFGALATGNRSWLDLWERLPADPTDPEVRRNFPIRFPTLWVRHLL